MNKYFGWIFAAVTSLSLVSAYAEDADYENDEATEADVEEQVAVIVDEDEEEIAE